MEIDPTSYNVILDSSVAVIVLESAINAFRIIFEMVTSVSERFDLDAALFQFFAATLLISRSQILPIGDVACALPVVALGLKSTHVGVYEGTVLATLFILLDSCAARLDAMVLIFLFLQMHGPKSVSNVLRISSLTSFFFAQYASSTLNEKYLCVLGMELASWATERYLLPWRIGGAVQCCNYGFRFFLGFVIGVHILDGRHETMLLRVDNSWIPTIKGIAVYNGRAYIRYAANPLGVLLAYCEGLQLVPIRIFQDAQSATHFHVYIFGSIRIVDIDVGNWSECDSRSEPLAAASRFPFRRVLLGMLIRYV